MKSNAESIKCTVGIKIGGESTKIQLDVPAGKVKPQRALPVFQKMTNSFVSGHIEKTENEGKPVSCTAGCTACCRQLIPISKIEAYALAKIVRNLPALNRRKITKKFENALETLRSSGWLKKMRGIANLDSEERQALGLEYFPLGVSCPFLEDDLCSIYEDRPLACREYMVTSPAANCDNPSADAVSMVPVQPKLSAVINTISKEIIGDGEPGYIPLVSALEWTERNPDRLPVQIGRKWVEILMGKLRSPDTRNVSNNKA